MYVILFIHLFIYLFIFWKERRKEIFVFVLNVEKKKLRNVYNYDFLKEMKKFVLVLTIKKKVSKKYV